MYWHSFGFACLARAYKSTQQKPPLPVYLTSGNKILMTESTDAYSECWWLLLVTLIYIKLCCRDFCLTWHFAYNIIVFPLIPARHATFEQTLWSARTSKDVMETGILVNEEEENWNTRPPPPPFFCLFFFFLLYDSDYWNALFNRKKTVFFPGIERINTSNLSHFRRKNKYIF